MHVMERETILKTRKYRIFYIKSRHKKDEFPELEKASQSSMSFWDNEIDDEVWNDV